MKNENGFMDGEFSFSWLVLGVAILFLAITSSIPLVTQVHNVNLTVIEKIPYHDGQYLIVAEVNGTEEVFSVSDERILLTFNASDRYAYLKEGGSYTVDICNIRIPLLSWYRNIYRIQRIGNTPL